MNDFCIKSRTVTDNENHSKKTTKKTNKKSNLLLVKILLGFKYSSLKVSLGRQMF